MTDGLFVGYSRADPGVFESQVLEVGKALQASGIDLSYLLVEGVRSWISSRREIGRGSRQVGQRFGADLELRYLPKPLSDWGLRRAGRIVARRLSQSSGRVLLWGRGAAATCAVLEGRRLLGDGAVLYDARSDEAAEARLTARQAATARARSRWLHRAERLEQLERRASREADHLLAVSSPLRRRICSLGGRPEDDCAVVPCCVDPPRSIRSPATRERTRRELGLNDRLVIVYSGSLGAYQMPAHVAALMSELCSRSSKVHFLALVHDPEAASRHFGDLLERGVCTVHSAPYERVGDYLAAADAGLLLREDDPVNRVACPVKFAEYQVAGLPVIATPHIGDVSEFLTATGHGLLVDLGLTVEQQAEMVWDWLEGEGWPPDGDLIRQAALQRFSRDSYSETYREILLRLGIAAEARVSPPGKSPWRAGDRA